MEHERRQKELEEKEIEECTFKPKISSEKQVDIPIWKRTNEYKEIIGKREKALDDKIKKECSFKPNINKVFF